MRCIIGEFLHQVGSTGPIIIDAIALSCGMTIANATARRDGRGTRILLSSAADAIELFLLTR